MNAVVPTSTRRRRWPWIVGALLLLFVAFAVLFDWNWLKGPIERRVTAATGRTFTIGGDLDVDLGLRPKIRAQDIHLGNAEWSREKEMVSLEQLEFRIALLPLLRGRVDMPYLHLQRPKLLIERDRAGRGNWQFSDEPAKGGSRPPLIRDLTIDDGVLRVHEPVLRTDLRLAIRSDDRRADQQRAPLVARGEGSYRGYPFKLTGRVDSPLDLQNSDKPFHVDVHAVAGETNARVSGASLAPLQFEDFDLHFEMAGPNLADLYALLGIPFPDTPPYRLSGQLGRQADVWSYRQFTGRVGDSDIAGDASIDIGGKRPLLQADLVARRLDFDDLAGVIGAPPSAKEGETVSEAQRKAAQALKAKPRVLPDTPFKLDKLRVMDAKVKLKAEQIDAPKLPLERMNLQLELRDGQLRLDPLDFHAAGGTIVSHVSLDAREASIVTTATADVRGLQLPKLFPKIDISKSGAGSISGVVALTAQGNSIAHMLGSANGDLGLIMGPGRISNLLLELAGLDVAESLKYLLDKDKRVPLRCAYAAFKIEDGVMTTRGLAFDTTDTVLYGQGKLTLRDETIDLRLVPEPKDVSPVSLRGPLHIGGTFKDPSFLPEAAPLALRGAAAAALYAIAPPAALLALVETGPGKDVDCGPAKSRGAS
jgi:AsmA family protein